MNLTNPTRLSRIWTLGAQPDPKLGSFRFIKYIIGLNPNLNPIQLDPFLTLRTKPIQLNPNLVSKIGFNTKKRVGFGLTRLNP